MSNFKLSNEEAHELVMNIRRSSMHEYPKNILTQDETRLCIQHAEQLADEDEKLSMACRECIFAITKISANYYGLKYELPGIAKQRYDELRVETYSEPISTILDIHVKNPKAKWFVAAFVLFFVVLSMSGDN